MKCVCGERLVRKGRNPGEDYLIHGRYVLVKGGVIHAVCRKCRRETAITPTFVKSRPKDTTRKVG